MIPTLLLPALVCAQAPIPRLDLFVRPLRRGVIYRAENSTAVWLEDEAGNALTADLPPAGFLRLPPGVYVLRALGYRGQVAAARFEVF